MHDNVNQLLATARLFIGLAKETEIKMQFPIVSEADKLIDAAITEIRNLSHSLISPFIDDYGLVEALEHLTGSVSIGSMLPIDKEIEIDENSMEQKLKLTIYRIIQEQLNNILKYAKATCVKIKLVQYGGDINLVIKDNGAGFNTAISSKGIGLMNIRTRLTVQRKSGNNFFTR